MWLTVARIPTGSHHESSTLTVGSASGSQQQQVLTGVGRVRAPPGPVALTRRIAQSAPVALVANTFVPVTIQPPSVRSTVVPNGAFSLGLRACGSPLHATHFSPRSTTPGDQRWLCWSVPSASIRTREFTWPLPTARRGQVGLGDLLGHHPEPERVAAVGAEPEPAVLAGRSPPEGRRRGGRRSPAAGKRPRGRTCRRGERVLPRELRRAPDGARASGLSSRHRPVRPPRCRSPGSSPMHEGRVVEQATAVDR